MASENNGSELLTVREVSAYLRVTRGSIQRFCREGRLPAVKIGRKEYRIRRSDLAAWYESLRPTVPNGAA